MDYIFYLPGVLFLISGIPQTIKLWKTKSSEDISVSMYLITCAAIILVVLDAYLHHNTSIMISNLASLFISATNTILTIKYKK